MLQYLTVEERGWRDFWGHPWSGAAAGKFFKALTNIQASTEVKGAQ